MGNQSSVESNKTMTPEEMLAAVRELGEELGRTPKTTDINGHNGTPAISKFYDYWNSWSEVVEEAGYTPTFNGNPAASQDKLIDELQEITGDLGRPPTEDEMMELSKEGKAYSVATYKKYFGSWGEAKVRAGLQPIRMSENTKGVTVPLDNVRSSVNND